MWCTVSFFIVYKNILAKFSYVYAGVILETEGSIQESASVNNCYFITIYCLNLAVKKELQEEVKKAQWSALRGFDWQHSKSYTMPQPTGLSCQTIFFVKFNICTYLQILREHISPYDFPVEQGHSVPYRDLFLKVFLANGGKFIWGEGGWGLVGGGGAGCSAWGINDQIMPRVREFYKYIFQ